MFDVLYKIASELDKKGEFEMADKIDAVVKSLAERVGLKMEEMVALADYFDEIGDTVMANQIDDLLRKQAAKKKETGKRPRPPKAWFEKMEKQVKKENPEYSKKVVRETIGKIWSDELSDKEVEKLLKRYKK